MAINTNAKAGDESRRNGDYIGFPTQETSDTELSSVAVPKGVPATLDTNGELAEASLDADPTVTGDSVIGVVYEYDVYGGNQGSNNRQLVDADADATVKTRGGVYADLSGVADDGGDLGPGTVLGANGEIKVVQATGTTGVYEVLVR